MSSLSTRRSAANGAVAAVLAVFGAACGSSATPAPPAWHVVFSDLQPTLLCVWGTSPDDVFAVGGALGNGTPAAMLHYDGASWRDLTPGGTATFWWAHGTGPGDVWAVGEQGRIAHWDGTVLTAHVSGTSATLFGVWAASPADVWAVGGTPGRGASATNDVVLHFDGTAWAAAPLPQRLGLAYFKVWGAAADDLYVVGEAGVVWHRRGGAWSLESMPPIATGTLLTVNGCGPSDVYAVGGRDVLHSDGGAWSRLAVSSSLENDVNGVSCGPSGVVVVGSGGVKERFANGAWNDDFEDAPHVDLHGAWADPAGGYWAAGGDFASGPVDGGARAGVLAYYGASPPKSALR